MPWSVPLQIFYLEVGKNSLIPLSLMGVHFNDLGVTPFPFIKPVDPPM